LSCLLLFLRTRNPKPLFDIWHSISQNFSFVSGTTYTLSIYLKTAGYTQCRIRFQSGAFGGTAQSNDVDFVDVFRNSFSDDGDDAVIAVMRYVKDGKSDGYNPFGSACDYCNNPSDAWPIIFQNDIMLNPSCADSLWKAEQGLRVKPSGFYSVATAYDTNPLRAAMIVYLMMKDEEK